MKRAKLQLLRAEALRAKMTRADKKRRRKADREASNYFDGRHVSEFEDNQPARNVDYLGSSKHPVARHIRIPRTADSELDLQAERAELEFQERKNLDRTPPKRPSKLGSHWATKRKQKK